MSIALCTLVLNEMEWLPSLYEQHKNWPAMSRWVFVESADAIYAQTNPDKVNEAGLSVDGTTEWLEDLCKRDDRIVHVKHGLSTAMNPAQGKCQSRQRYLDEIAKARPSHFIVVDADEFYMKDDQLVINAQLVTKTSYTAFVYKHRDIWRPPSISDRPLFDLEVTGGFWSIPYCRCWRWSRNLSYSSNHNTPQQGGRLLDAAMLRCDISKFNPEFIHMGFAANPANREAKNAYYEARGEAVDPRRSWYCDSRRCFSTWKPGDVLPKRATVIPYTGPIPECFI